MAPRSRTMATTSTAATVVRTRTDARLQRASATVARQPVPRTAQRLDRLASERAVDLVAEVSDVDLDDVGIALEVKVPHSREDLPLGEHVPLMTGQEGEQRVLPSGELDLGITAPDP